MFKYLKRSSFIHLSIFYFRSFNRRIQLKAFRSLSLQSSLPKTWWWVPVHLIGHESAHFPTLGAAEPNQPTLGSFTQRRLSEAQSEASDAQPPPISKIGHGGTHLSAFDMASPGDQSVTGPGSMSDIPSYGKTHQERPYKIRVCFGHDLFIWVESLSRQSSLQVWEEIRPVVQWTLELWT